ncbi:MAG: hypothetical protein ACRCYZ_06460 [Alphaproteobacteria bacterium]
MENLEVKATSKGMWWDGEYGGVAKDGKFKLLFVKPYLPTLSAFDAMSCFPGAGDRGEYCYTIFHGVKAELNEAHIQYVDSVIDLVFPDAGSGGSGGVTNLRIDKAGMAIAFTDEAGRASKLPFPELKATPMEFYLDVTNPDVTKTAKLPSGVVVGTEYVIPIGAISLTGRNHYITIDRTTNRVVIPQGGLRGTLRINGAFRFDPSVKADMDIDLTWYCRKAGSSDAWTAIYTGNAYRTASQTTAALSFPTSSTYYNLPDYPIECEVRVKFNKVGTGIDWSTIPLFNSTSDGVKISLLCNPNYAYTT